MHDYRQNRLRRLWPSLLLSVGRFLKQAPRTLNDPVICKFFRFQIDMRIRIDVGRTDQVGATDNRFQGKRCLINLIECEHYAKFLRRQI